MDSSQRQRRSFSRAGKVALLVVDMQRYCCVPGRGCWRDTPELHNPDHYFFNRLRDRVIPNVALLQRAMRANRQGEVIFTVIESLTRDGRGNSTDYKLTPLHVPHGSDDARVVGEVAPEGDEIVVPKTSSSVFNSTSIEYTLRNLGVTHLIVCGLVTESCVEGAVRDAADRGFLVTLAEDACTSTSAEGHQRGVAGCSGFARVLTTADICREIRSLRGASEYTLAVAPVANPIVRLCLLRTEDEPTYGAYVSDMFNEMLQKAAGDSYEVRLEEYFVKEGGTYPPETTWGEFDGFIIPGSLNSANDAEPWIERLCDVIRVLNERRIRMLGICFGHQLIAHALGGRVERNPNGPQLGRKEFDCPTRLACGPGEVSILYCHGDIVTALPAGAQNLGTSEHCPVHAMAVGDHILTFQGHPEFATAAGRQSLASILGDPSGITARVSPDVAQEAKASSLRDTDSDAVALACLHHFSRHLPRQNPGGITPREVLDFWFDGQWMPIEGRFERLSDGDFVNRMVMTLWFNPIGDQTLQRAIDARCAHFEEAVWASLRCALGGEWETTDDGLFAQLILCDQLSRNIFRGTENAFRFDQRGMELLRLCHERGMHSRASLSEMTFMQTPAQHSESLGDHEIGLQIAGLCVETFAEPEGVARIAQFALTMTKDHHDVVARFHRYPHRNAALGRTSTAEELEYLQGDLPQWARSQHVCKKKH